MRPLWIFLLLGLMSCSVAKQSEEAGPPGHHYESERPAQPEIPIPTDWQFIDSIPVRTSPDFASSGCQSSIPSADHAQIEDQIARYLVGEDTVYLDRVRSIYWPYASYDGCKYEYRDLTDAQRMTLHSYYALDTGATVDLKSKHFYEAIPSLYEKRVDGKHFVYVNQQSQITGAGGYFFPGDSKTRPVNIYGYQLELETKQSITDLVKTMEFE